MEVAIRKSLRQDIPAIFGLIKELAVFERAADRVMNSVEQMEAEQESFECVVAETTAGEVVGMALFYPVYFTWVGKSMYLDDLVVSEAWRGQGIGTRLLERVIEEARDRDCKRLRWQVLDWNGKAIDLYRRYGCSIEGEWLNCDLSLSGS
jgi:diamine N-acetyltransferase